MTKKVAPKKKRSVKQRVRRPSKRRKFDINKATPQFLTKYFRILFRNFKPGVGVHKVTIHGNMGDLVITETSPKNDLLHVTLLIGKIKATGSYIRYQTLKFTEVEKQEA